MDLKGQKIFVAGHLGMVGSAVVRRLENEGISPIIAPRDQLDLRDQAAVRNFIGRERPDVIINAAAKIGGIHANDTQPVDFLYDNMMIGSNLVEAAYRNDVKK
ncbi:MAG: NAD-dependent epimerase/dehydratase family protein, partial [Fimbriimonadaceae bacterium]|nr:NAD-dependent epimerase/dehydratase family protein [Alphaproteobacteria bacterium]